MRFYHFYNAILMAAQWARITVSKTLYTSNWICCKHFSQLFWVRVFRFGSYTMCPYIITTLNRAFDLTWITTFAKQYLQLLHERWCAVFIGWCQIIIWTFRLSLLLFYSLVRSFVCIFSLLTLAKSVFKWILSKSVVDPFSTQRRWRVRLCFSCSPSLRVFNP